MTYIEAAVSAVPNANKQDYEKFALQTGAIFKDHGLLALIECWGEDVPEGDLTSFPLAVKLQDGETVALSWMVWPDKTTRDEGWRTIMEDPRMAALGDMPFDGKRMIFGGFEPIVEL